MIFELEERLEAAALRDLQERRWERLAGRLASHPFHRDRLDSHLPLDELASLPFTTKQDLWDAYPYGLLAVEQAAVRRIHATSGTKGRPTIVAYSAADLELFRRVNARALAAAGAGPGTVVHNAYGYGLFTGGLGLHGGGEALGCAVVPVSGGQTARQVTLVRDLRPEVICCTPSYAVLLGEALHAAGVTAAENPLRAGIFGAEPWTEQMRARIEELHGLTALDIYGLSEAIGPGVASECLESRAELAGGRPGGMHLNEDHFFPEIVDPYSGGAPLEDGEVGELVLTTLTKEALPLVRYRTGDLTRLERSPCPCGRTTVRMARLVGRADDMLVVRGVNVYPAEIESVVLAAPGLAPHYVIVLDTTGAMAELVVACERAGAATDRADAGEISAALAERLGITARVVVGDPGSLPRTEVGKAVRVLHRTPDSPALPAELGALIAKEDQR